MTAIRFDPWAELAVLENAECAAAPAKAAKTAKLDAAQSAAVTRADLPAEWTEGVACLRAMARPAMLRPDRWQQAIIDAVRFLDQWGAQAAALGWSTRDVFGVHPTHTLARLDCAGLVILLHGDEVVALTADTARTRRPSGAILTCYRRRRPEAVPLWALT